MKSRMTPQLPLILSLTLAGFAVSCDMSSSGQDETQEVLYDYSDFEARVELAKNSSNVLGSLKLAVDEMGPLMPSRKLLRADTMDSQLACAPNDYDVDGNGVFNLQDVYAALKLFQGTSQPSTLHRGDMDCSGKIDFHDIAALIAALEAQAVSMCDPWPDGKLDFADLQLALLSFKGYISQGQSITIDTDCNNDGIMNVMDIAAASSGTCDVIGDGRLGTQEEVDLSVETFKGKNWDGTHPVNAECTGDGVINVLDIAFIIDYSN